MDVGRDLELSWPRPLSPPLLPPFHPATPFSQRTSVGSPRPRGESGSVTKIWKIVRFGHCSSDNHAVTRRLRVFSEGCKLKTEGFREPLQTWISACVHVSSRFGLRRTARGLQLLPCPHFNLNFRFSNADWSVAVRWCLATK